MTQYASKTPRDLNHDPLPYVTRAGNRYEDGIWYGHDMFRRYLDPRPEFDHVQHNAPNPLLLDMREFWPVIVGDWLAALDDPWFTDGVPQEFGSVTEDHIDHARRVLSRLAAIDG